MVTRRGGGPGGGPFLPRHTGQPDRPEDRGADRAPMPGCQARMSGTPPQRGAPRRSPFALDSHHGNRLAPNLGVDNALRLSRARGKLTEGRLGQAAGGADDGLTADARWPELRHSAPGGCSEHPRPAAGSTTNQLALAARPPSPLPIQLQRGRAAQPELSLS